MKPIHLSFSGLHSYRDTQHVDFTQLCEGGLFGIFGPTGSGKSTVLDAITLALYARVDRATGGRQGIMNDGMDDLTVSFTFEIGNDGERQRYCVERSYKRSGPQNIRIAHARLSLGDGSARKVLADKDSEVSAAIESIIGLTFDDFTRAVVLPQGKFAQFIAMTGGDRRKMLERLFALEQFGQQLVDKVRNQLRRAEHELEKITSEQSGLGDASPERMAELERVVQQAAAAVTAADKQRRQAMVQQRQAEQQRDVQVALEKTQSQLQPLLEAQTEIEQKKQRVRLAEAAEPLRPLIEHVDKLRAELVRAKGQAAEVTEMWEQAQRAIVQAEEALARARTERKNKEPELTEKRSALQSAAKDEQQLQEMQRRLLALEAEITELQKTRDTLGRQKQDQADRLQSLTAELQRLRDQQTALTVPPPHRRLIQDAASAWERLDHANAALAAAQKELEQKTRTHAQALTVYKQHHQSAVAAQEKLQAKQAELEQLQNAPPTDEDTLAAAVQFLERMRGITSQLDALQAEHDAAVTALADAKKQLDAAQRLKDEATAKQQKLQQRLAAVEDMLRAAREAAAADGHGYETASLAAALRPGSPCPVCGSKHHPNPATANDAALHHWRKAEAEAAQLKEQHAAAQHNTQLATVKWEHAQIEVNTKHEGIDTVNRRIAKLRTSLPGTWQDLELSDIHRALQAEAHATEQQQLQARQWQQSVRQLQTEYNEAIQGASSYQKKEDAAGRQLAAAEAQQQSALTHLEQVQLQRDTALSQFRQKAYGMTPDDIHNELEAIQTKDEQTEAVVGAIQHITAQLPELQQQLAASETAFQETVAAIQKLESHRLLAQNDAERLTAQVHRVTGGNPAAEMLAHVNRTLEQLLQSETEATKQYDAARQAATNARQQLAVAADRVERLTADADQTEGQLASGIQRAGFTTVQDATAALLPPAERTALADRIAAHTTALQQLTSRHDELEKQLGGRIVTDAMWRDVVERAETAEKAFVEANNALGAAKKLYEVTGENHARWTALAKRKRDIDRVKERLAQLSTLLRGNRFVDFVAEEYLTDVVRAASIHLGALTRQRYALELDAEGAFIIRDDANGGIRRPVTSLSGGETFITSLALALALSHQIQLHGQYPLEFFFLDEGFGTLDPDLLETVIVSLERLQNERVSIGLISHVPELRPRVARRLIVKPASPGTEGSQLVFERG